MLALLNSGFACWVRFSVHGGTPKKSDNASEPSSASEGSSEEMAAEADPLMGTLLGALMVGGAGKAMAANTGKRVDDTKAYKWRRIGHLVRRKTH